MSARRLERRGMEFLPWAYRGLSDDEAEKYKIEKRPRWWDRRYSFAAQTVRAAQVARVPAERPPVLPRPPGMSRQVHRALYRAACKARGVPWRPAQHT